jgi:hypothetical protein
MSCTSFTNIQASLHQVEVATNPWSPDDILNNEDAHDNWVDVQQMCHTLVNMLDALLTDGGYVSDDGQSHSNVGSKHIHYSTYSH